MDYEKSTNVNGFVVREGVKHVIREQRQRKPKQMPSWNIPMLLEQYWTAVTEAGDESYFGVVIAE